MGETAPRLHETIMVERLSGGKPGGKRPLIMAERTIDETIMAEDFAENAPCAHKTIMVAYE